MTILISEQPVVEKRSARGVDLRCRGRAHGQVAHHRAHLSGDASAQRHRDVPRRHRRGHLRRDLAAEGAELPDRQLRVGHRRRWTTACAASPATSRARSTTSTTRSTRSRTTWPSTSASSYEMFDVNVYQENIFHTKMHVKEFDLDTLPVRGARRRPLVQGTLSASSSCSSARSRSCSTVATWCNEPLARGLRPPTSRVGHGFQLNPLPAGFFVTSGIDAQRRVVKSDTPSLSSRFEAAAISVGTGSGNRARPAPPRGPRGGFRPPSSWPGSRDCGVPPAGSFSRCSSRCASTWRSVSTTKPRFQPSPRMPASSADRIAARIPDGVEQAGATVQFAQAFRAPGQVVGFLAPRRAGAARVRCSRATRGLADVERLRADLADVVDRASGRRHGALGVVQDDVRPAAADWGGRGGCRRPCPARSVRPPAGGPAE